MNKTILAAVPVLALVTSVALPLPAAAQNAPAERRAAEQSTTGDIQKDAKEAWRNIKHDASEAYEDIKAVLVEENNKPVVISTRHTAHGMIGKAVYNGNKEHVGTVKDIVVDGNGKAAMLVIADGVFPGFDGKLVAFDYGVISRLDAEGDVIAPISEEAIEKAAEFSYDRNARADGKVRVIPDNGYSISALLDGDLVDPEGDDVADIDDISFKNGQAVDVIVSFGKVIGMGGHKAVLGYKTAELVRDGDDLDLRLNATQAAQFENLKKAAEKQN